MITSKEFDFNFDPLLIACYTFHFLIHLWFMKVIPSLLMNFCPLCILRPWTPEKIYLDQVSWLCRDEEGRYDFLRAFENNFRMRERVLCVVYKVQKRHKSPLIFSLGPMANVLWQKMQTSLMIFFVTCSSRLCSMMHNGLCHVHK